MTEFGLFLFPVAIVTILVFGAGVMRRGEFSHEAWGLGQAKALEAFAALMIILHHLVQTITNYGNVVKGPVTLWNSFGILFTTVFFFFSGFGLFKSYKTRENYLGTFWKHRLTKVLLPFLLTNVIYLCFVSGGKLSGAWQGVTAIFGTPLLNSNAWFVLEILLLYVAFYVCFRFIKFEWAAMLVVTLFTVLMITFSLLLGHDSTSVTRRWFMGEWWYNTTIFFVVGIFFAKYEMQVKAWMEKRYKLLLPLSVVLLIGWYVLEQYVDGHFGYYKEWPGHPGYPEKLLTLVVQIVLCMLFLSVLLLVNLKVEFHNRVLLFLGGISYEIFLIHGLFRSVLNHGLPDVLYVFLVYACSAVAAWIIHFGLHKLTSPQLPLN